MEKREEEMDQPESLIALSHYCEKHGPKIISITRPQFSSGIEDDDGDNNDRNNNDENGRRRRRDYYGEVSVLQNHSKSKTNERRESESCFACESPSSIFVTNDHENRVSYATLSAPNSETDPERARVLNHVALRVCSCEVSQFTRNNDRGVGGPLIFYDERLIKGLTVAYVFTVKDTESRGFTRTYAIFVHTSHDHRRARRISSTILKHFETIAKFIQEKCFQTFSEESELNTVNPHPRDLAAITRCADIYVKLHSQFSLILKNLSTEINPVVVNDVPAVRKDFVKSHHHQDVSSIIFKNLKSTKSRQQLCYLLMTGGTLNIVVKTSENIVDKKDYLKHVVNSLFKLCPPTSKFVYIEDNVALIQGCSSDPSIDSVSLGTLFCYPDSVFDFGERSCQVPHPTPRLVTRALKIMSNNSNYELAIQAVQQEIMGLAKLWSLKKTNTFKSVLKTQNLMDNDEIIISVWAQGIHPSFLLNSL